LCAVSGVSFIRSRLAVMFWLVWPASLLAWAFLPTREKYCVYAAFLALFTVLMLRRLARTFLRVRAEPPMEPLILAPSVRKTFASSGEMMICIRAGVNTQALAASTGILLACMLAGCATNHQAQQRDRERAAIVAAMEKLNQARKVCVREAESGATVPDVPRLFAEWEGIDVSECPADFCAAWDGMLESFKRGDLAPRPRVNLRKAAVDVPLVVQGDLLALPAALEDLFPGPSPEAQQARAEFLRALERLKRVIERYRRRLRRRRTNRPVALCRLAPLQRRVVTIRVVTVLQIIASAAPLASAAPGGRFQTFVHGVKADQGGGQFNSWHQQHGQRHTSAED
jgi:hypothetical protein